MTAEILPKLDQILGEQHRQGDILEQLIKMVGATNAKLDDTNSKLDSLADGQERHERTLEMLSLRSIEQEAKISDIKRLR